MIDDWISDFEDTSRNALSVEWFVSPLEYFWPDGKALFDKLFSRQSTPSSTFDELTSPAIFKNSMQIDFRAKMMVLAFMRQDISKSYGFEIENGLLHLYPLDFISCLSQWIYVVEGYCRRLFSVASLQNVRHNSWQRPTPGYATLLRVIDSLSTSLATYLDGVLFQQFTVTTDLLRL